MNIKHYIYGFATSRSEAVKSLGKNSGQIASHITKCVAYGKHFSSYKHWIEELTNWLTDAGSLSIKHKGKFTEEAYEDILFGALGDDEPDAEHLLFELHEQVRRRKVDYPDFEMTDDLVRRLCVASRRITTLLTGYFVDLDRYETADKDKVRQILCSVLDRHSVD